MRKIGWSGRIVGAPRVPALNRPEVANLSILTIVLIALAALVAAALLYALTRPDAFEVARSTDIKAAPETIFPLMNSPRLANEWNPFVKADPAIRLAYSGPQSGVGAASSWEGNSRVGKGSVEIVESTPNSKVVLDLRMLKPMKADNRVEYLLEPRGGFTRVTWRMSGAQPFIGKLMSIVMDCEKMVGPPFEKGLADLKAMAEK